MLKMIDVVAAIIEQDGQILLAQRPPHADQPGMWEFAGGKVEPGESQRRRWPANCRRRWASSPARLAISLAISGRSPAAGSICTPGGCRTFQGTPLAHYHTQLRWCLPTEALALDLAPADIPLLHAFIAQRPTLSVR